MQAPNAGYRAARITSNATKKAELVEDSLLQLTLIKTPPALTYLERDQ
jgi:hypothetical protein